jgi:hypothetical protein
MLMMFFFGWEKETERCPRSFVSFPAVVSHASPRILKKIFDPYLAGLPPSLSGS